MKTVTICGSMRFEKEMQAVALTLELDHGLNVLQPVYNPTGRTIGELEKTALAAAHYHKIEMSDSVYVVDIGGYIGQSVKEEILFAKQKGKEVLYHSAFMAE